MLDFEPRLESDLVRLEPLTTQHVSSLFEITQNPEMWTFFTEDLSTLNSLTRWVGRAVIAREKLLEIPFVIIDGNTSKIAGSTRFGNISDRDKRIEIGWTFLGEEFRGKGLNQEVKRLLIDHAFAAGFERVEAKTDVLNVPARKALVKAGFTEEGILRSHTVMTNNRRRDTIYYSVLADEWHQNQQKH